MSGQIDQVLISPRNRLDEVFAPYKLRSSSRLVWIWTSVESNACSYFSFVVNIILPRPQLYNENNPASWLFLLFCVPAISWKLIGRNDYPYYLNLVRLKCIWSLDRGPPQKFMYDGGWGNAYWRSLSSKGPTLLDASCPSAIFMLNRGFDQWTPFNQPAKGNWKWCQISDENRH